MGNGFSLILSLLLLLLVLLLLLLARIIKDGSSLLIIESLTTELAFPSCRVVGFFLSSAPLITELAFFFLYLFS